MMSNLQRSGVDLVVIMIREKLANDRGNRRSTNSRGVVLPEEVEAAATQELRVLGAGVAGVTHKLPGGRRSLSGSRGLRGIMARGPGRHGGAFSRHARGVERLLLRLSRLVATGRRGPESGCTWRRRSQSNRHASRCGSRRRCAALQLTQRRTRRKLRQLLLLRLSGAGAAATGLRGGGGEGGR